MLRFRPGNLALAVVGCLATASPAWSQRITAYEPTSAAAGTTVTIRGEGIGSRAADHSVRYGQGGSPIGSLTILSWNAGRTRVAIGAQLPGTIAAGTYWLAVYQGSAQVARGPETFVVTGGGGPGPGITIRPSPQGIVAPIQPQVRLSPELSVVAVERTTTGPIEAGSRIPVRVRVRNASAQSAEIAVGWVGDRPFPTAGYHSDPRTVPASGEAEFMLELTPVPSHTRDGRFTTHVALLDPRSFSLFTTDGNRLDNSMEVSFDLGVPEFYDITVTWNRLMVIDDTDPSGSGEWWIVLGGCTPDYGRCDRRDEQRWPASGTMDVSGGRPASVAPSISFTRVPRAQGVTIYAYARDDDGDIDPGQRWESGGDHRVEFDPATWRWWGRAASIELDRSTLRAGPLFFTGTLTILAQPSR